MRTEFRARVEDSLGRPSRLLAQARVELEEYLAGRRQELGLPFRLPEGATPFQRAVWAELLRIPYGSVKTYGELAKRLRTSPRAVGGALRANPLPVIVPCHRVVARGGLGGFGGTRFLDFKRFLLDLEQGRMLH